MPIRTILVPFLDAASSKQAIATALVVAGAWGAHVIALHVSTDVGGIAPPVPEKTIVTRADQSVEIAEREVAEHAFVAEALFRRALAESDPLLSLKGSSPAKASFMVIAGPEEEIVAERARLADLTVIAHPGTSGSASSTDAVRAVLFHSNCPILLATRRPPSGIGRRVCLAWNGTTESAAAVNAALPWLERADAVLILSSEEYQRRGPPAAELASYLISHGVMADVSSFHPHNGIIGAGLLSAASAFDADLIAMGAYSDSPLHQRLFGGVTRHVLEKAELPVLMCR